MAILQDGNSEAGEIVEYIGLRDKTRSRNRLLAELEGLPDSAYVTARHAAAYIDTSYANLANWRMHRRGPPFVGAGRNFIRYKLGDLKKFMTDGIKATVALNEGGEDGRRKEAKKQPRKYGTTTASMRECTTFS